MTDNPESLALKSSAAWAHEARVVILDADGWDANVESWEELITFEEFNRRLMNSTIDWLPR